MHRIGALVGILLLLLSPQAAASHLEPLSPPSWSGGNYDEATHTINLTWLPPGNDTTTPYLYHVYRDGTIVANTTQTWHVEEVAWSHAVYYVVAEGEEGESPPSMPLLVENQAQGGGSGPGALFEIKPDPLGHGGYPDIPLLDCPIVRIWLIPDPPFVSYTVYERCIPIIGPLVEINDDPMVGA